MRIALCPGSFDPVTNGHIDIFERGAKLFDKLIITLAQNFEKKYCFTLEKRILYIEKATAHIPNVEVRAHSGLLVDFAKEQGARFVLRGVRDIADFQYESSVAAVYHHLDDEIESVFLLSHGQNAHISSRIVRELGSYGANIRGLVPDLIIDDVTKQLYKI